MADILIRGYKAKEQIEEIIAEARYAANNCMIGEGLEIIELPEHGDLISRDQAFQMMLDRGYQKEAAGVILEVPVIVPANKEESK